MQYSWEVEYRGVDAWRWSIEQGDWHVIAEGTATDKVAALTSIKWNVDFILEREILYAQNGAEI
jgi:hypothetical protein